MLKFTRVAQILRINSVLRKTAVTIAPVSCQKLSKQRHSLSILFLRAWRAGWISRGQKNWQKFEKIRESTEKTNRRDAKDAKN